MRRWVMVCCVVLSGTPALSKTRRYCGKRDGTAGNAALVDRRGNEVLTLSVQGGAPSLLDQADALVGRDSGVRGETGTQNGKRYCVVAELDGDGEPVRIVKAWRER